MSVLRVDNSTLRAESHCGTQAHVRYGLGFTAESGKSVEAEAGIVWHETMASWLTGAPWPQALREAASAWSTRIDPLVTAGKERLAWSNAGKIMARFAESYPTVEALPFQVVPSLIEVSGAYPLTDEGDIILTFRLDAAVKSAGRWWVLDWKTTGRMDDVFGWWSAFRADSQLSGYVWALTRTLEALGDPTPVAGAIIGGVELSRLPSDPVRKCPTHALPYLECGPYHSKFAFREFDRTPEALAEWRRTAISLAVSFRRRLRQFPSIDSVHRIRTQGTFNGSCRWCEFSGWCLAGRPLRVVGSVLRYDPWDPTKASRTADPLPPTLASPSPVVSLVPGGLTLSDFPG